MFLLYLSNSDSINQLADQWKSNLKQYWYCLWPENICFLDYWSNIRKHQYGNMEMEIFHWCLTHLVPSQSPSLPWRRPGLQVRVWGALAWVWVERSIFFRWTRHMSQGSPLFPELFRWSLAASQSHLASVPAHRCTQEPPEPLCLPTVYPPNADQCPPPSPSCSHKALCTDIPRHSFWSLWNKVFFWSWPSTCKATFQVSLDCVFSSGTHLLVQMVVGVYFQQNRHNNI